MATPVARVVRAPIFREAPADRLAQAIVATTPKGSRRFEQARRRLATLAKREPEHVSDADVREFLARGELATQAYLAE